MKPHRLTMIVVTAGLLAACQSGNRNATTVAAVPPPPQPTHILALELSCSHRPPCPMGTVEDLATGDVTTIYDLDLSALNLPDMERSALRRALDGTRAEVAGRLESRNDLPMADGALPVMVVIGVTSGS